MVCLHRELKAGLFSPTPCSFLFLFPALPGSELLELLFSFVFFLVCPKQKDEDKVREGGRGAELFSPQFGLMLPLAAKNIMFDEI